MTSETAVAIALEAEYCEHSGYYTTSMLVGAPPRGSPKDFGTPVTKIDSHPNTPCVRINYAQKLLR